MDEELAAQGGKVHNFSLNPFLRATGVKGRTILTTSVVKGISYA
jgi:hypothetical protein